MNPYIAILGFFLIPLVGWIDAQSHFARGLGLFQLSLIPKEILWRGLSGVLLVGALAVWPGAVLPVEFVLVTLIMVLIAVAIGQISILRKSFILHVDPNDKSQQRDCKELAYVSRRLWINSVSNMFLSNADVLIVGLLIGTKEAGFYFAANRLAQMLAFFAGSYNVVISPRLASSWSAGDRRAAREFVRSAAIKSTVPTLITAAAIWFYAAELLSVFGDDYVNAISILKILVLAGIVNAVLGPADVALNMCGFEDQALKVSAASLILGVFGLTLGAIYYGSIGVAAATLTISIFRKGAYWLLALKFMALRSDALAPPQSAVQIARAT